jgi:hypothetical protein
LAIFLVFIDASENLVMMDDVAMPSNPLVTLLEQEEFEEVPFDVNVFQWLCEEEQSKQVMRT